MCNDHQNDSFADFLARAEDEDFAKIPTVSDEEAANEPVLPHTCEHCAGTGEALRPIWSNGGQLRIVGHRKGKCPVCKGRGGFRASAAKRADNRRKSRARRIQKACNVRDAFIAQHPDEWKWLKDKAEVGHFQFACDMYDNVAQGRGLSENMLAAVQRCMQKDAEREKERNTPAAQITIKPILDHMLTAKNRLMEKKGTTTAKVVLRTERLKLSLASDHSANPGHVYIKDTETNEYLGKIRPDGALLKVRQCTDDHIEDLKKFAANPAEEARLYGKRFGVCCCCGRELTNKRSIADGIGPICAENWGL